VGETHGDGALTARHHDRAALLQRKKEFDVFYSFFRYLKDKAHL
jgi:hypothetical protein